MNIIGVSSAPYVWTCSSTFGNWSDSANWSGGQVPNSPDAVVLIYNNTTNTIYVRVDSDFTIGRLILVSSRTNTTSGAGGLIYITGTNATVSSPTTTGGNTSLIFQKSSGPAELYIFGDTSSTPVFTGEIKLNSDMQMVSCGITQFTLMKCPINLNGYKLYRYGRNSNSAQIAIDVDQRGKLAGSGEIHLVEGLFMIRYGATSSGTAKIFAYVDHLTRQLNAINFNNYGFNVFSDTATNTTIPNDFQFVRSNLPSNSTSNITRGAYIYAPPTSAKAIFTGAWSGDLYPNGYTGTFDGATRPIYFTFSGDQNVSGYRFGIWLEGNHSGMSATQDPTRGVLYISRYGGPIKLGAGWTPPPTYRLRIGGRTNETDRHGDCGFLIDSPRTITPTETEFESWNNFGAVTFGTGTTTTSGSTTLTFSSGYIAAYFYVGQPITSTAFPAGTTVASIPNQRTLVMSNAATVTSSSSTSFTTTSRPRACAYNVFGASHTSGDSTWRNNFKFNHFDTTTNGSAASTVLLVRGTSTLTLPGIFYSNTSGEYNPVYKMGTGEAILSGVGSTITKGQFIVREGTLTVNGTFTATGVNATNFIVGLTKYTLVFNEVIKNTQEVQPVVNGTTLANIVYSSNDVAGTNFYGDPTSFARPFMIIERIISQQPEVGIIWSDTENAVQTVDGVRWKDFEVYPRDHAPLNITFNTNAGSTLTYTYTEVGPAVATLRGTGTVAGSVTVMDHSNASIQPGSTASPYGTLTVGSLTAGANSKLRFAASGASISKITVNGNYTATGTFVITGTLQAGTYDLITCTGTLTAGTTSLDTSGASGFSSASLSVNVGSKKVQLIVT